MVLEKAGSFPERFSVELFETLGLDKGIVYAQGSPHRNNKRACVPSFESSVSMATFLEAIQAETIATEQRWLQQAEHNGGKVLQSSPLPLPLPSLNTPTLPLPR